MTESRRRGGAFRIGTASAVALAMALAGLSGLAAPSAWAAIQEFGRVRIGEPAPDFTLPGADGRRHSLSSYAGKIVVLEWTSPVCQYTAAHYDNGQMQALQRTAAGKGVVWLSINTTGSTAKPGYLTPRQAAARVRRTRSTVSAFLIDADATVGRRYGARTTPSFVIIGKDGKVAYQGAIDNDVYATGEATRNYVREAIDALAAGRAPETAETRPYGCPVEY